VSLPRTRTPKTAKQKADEHRKYIRDKAKKLSDRRRGRANRLQAEEAGSPIWSPADAYRNNPATKEAVDDLYRFLEEDLGRIGSMIKKFPRDVVTKHPELIREVTGVKLALRRKIKDFEDEINRPGLARPFFHVYVYKTRLWERYDALRVQLFHHSRRYKKWSKWYKATPERIASVKAAQARHDASPQRAAYEDSGARKAAEALRKRMAYFGVSDPKDLPGKSTRGRKPAFLFALDNEGVKILPSVGVTGSCPKCGLPTVPVMMQATKSLIWDHHRDSKTECQLYSGQHTPTVKKKSKKATPKKVEV